MLFYGISEQKIRTILKSPTRVETGIAEGTVAAMKKSLTKKRPEEIWIMYQVTSNKRQATRDGKPTRMLMISAWRYPGVSKPGATIPIPEDILDELLLR